MADRETRNLARDYAKDPSDRNAQKLARAAMRLVGFEGEPEPCPRCESNAPDSAQAYWADVRGIVEDLEDRARSGEIENEEELYEAAHETIDGAGRVIYTHQAKLALVHSDNAGAYADDFGGEEPNWSAMAFCAMRRDVAERMESFEDLATPYECPECPDRFSTEAEAEACCADDESEAA